MKQDLAGFHDFLKSQFSSHNIKTYHDIGNWSSLQTLVVVSAIDEKFDLLIPYEILNDLKSIEELYLYIKSNS